jgi:hypothetical protein
VVGYAVAIRLLALVESTITVVRPAFCVLKMSRYVSLLTYLVMLNSVRA